MHDQKPTSTPHHILYGCSPLPGHSRVEGVTVSAAYSGKSIQGAREFDFKEDDVIVSAYPRTGATLVQELVYQLIHQPDDLASNITDRSPCLEYHGRAHTLPPMGLNTASKLANNRVLKTHLPYRFLQNAFDSGTKVIYIMRNPKDLCASYYETYKGYRLWGNWNFSTFQHLFFNTDKLSFGNVFDHYLGYWQARAESNVLIVFYEDLIRNKKREIYKIAKFLKVNIDTEKVKELVQLTKFDAMKENKNMDPIVYERNTAQVRLDYDFYRRGIVGYWREYFNPMEKKYDDVIRRRMTSEGIYFNYGDGNMTSLCDKCGSMLEQKCKKNDNNELCAFKLIDF